MDTQKLLEEKTKKRSDRVPLVLIYNRTCDALRDLVAFVQFKKREKHSWRSVDFSKVGAEGCRFV